MKNALLTPIAIPTKTAATKKSGMARAVIFTIFLVSEGILERQTFAEVPPRVEYRLTQKGQELIESITDLLEWMRRWSKSK